jgi:DnaK suppressor protein
MTKNTKNKTCKETEHTLSATEYDYFQELLLKKRHEILRNVNEFQDEALNKSRKDAAGDLSSMPLHMADLGTDNFEQEFAIGLMDTERKLLTEIDAALDRLKNGVYGICEGTQTAISKPRLEAQPWARHCVDYARKREQGLS